MSNGTNGLFVFIEQGTDPTLGEGFDAPINSICTYLGQLLRKNGDSPTDWVPAAGGGGGEWQGGTVPNPATFLKPVIFEDTADFLDTSRFYASPNFMNGFEVTGGSVQFGFGFEVIGGDYTRLGHANSFNTVTMHGIQTQWDEEQYRMGFFGVAPTVQGPVIPDAAGGPGPIDPEARAAINALLAQLRVKGFIPNG